MSSLAQLGVSVVIPTLNAAETLPATLAALGAAEVVVADGGSSDATVELAGAAAASVVRSPTGRGPQLAAGAEAANGQWLLFLHADTVPTGDWLAQVTAFVTDPANGERAAAFRFAIDMPGAGARRLERWVAWRCRVLALPYGDQALLIGKEFYREIGGYRALPLMEDVDLVRRIGRARLVLLDATMFTSGRRYRQSGLARRGLRNLACLGLYFLGLPPRLIARLYG
jgi:rSAM/selenodomain-associated transferase 2